MHANLLRFGLLLAFAAGALTAPVQGQTTNGYDFESLLGKSSTSPEVQNFIKSNQLIHQPTQSPYSICQSTNSSSPFILCACSNRIDMVSVTLVKTTMVPYVFPPYTGKHPYGLRPGETVESVIQRLGPPTHRDLARIMPYLWYEKLHLQMDFDLQKGLSSVTWREKLSREPL